MKKKIITGCIAAFVTVVAIIAFTIEANAVKFCVPGDNGICLVTSWDPAFKCYVSGGPKDCNGTYDKDFPTDPIQ